MIQTNRELTDEIMKLVNNMADSSMIEAAIIKALQIKHRQGCEAGAESERRYPHGQNEMGR